ncbi:hypothetical protein FRX31_022070 [Thalictrum thalictroides]|uniref:Uncharacterized protein n=1 Tax=Thalictrum thalictroides TaxID=46969 RepID=A0A7J6VVC4_THATH|nr:hypothetical protein FRX31_022070 [Thalictrum thalictroides]
MSMSELFLTPEKLGLQNLLNILNKKTSRGTGNSQTDGLLNEGKVKRKQEIYELASHRIPREEKKK